MSRLYQFFFNFGYPYYAHIPLLKSFLHSSKYTLRSITIMDEMTFVDTYLGHAGLHVRNVSNNIYPQIPNMAKVTRGNGL